MRAREFIRETRYGNAADVPANGKKLPRSQYTAMKGLVSLPDLSQNKQGGSPYMQWRFGIAMAGAPDVPIEPAGTFAGDPLLATYSDAELEIVNAAARMIGAGEVRRVTDNRSHEAEWVQKNSPIKGFKGYPR